MSYLVWSVYIPFVLFYEIIGLNPIVKSKFELGLIVIRLAKVGAELDELIHVPIRD